MCGSVNNCNRTEDKTSQHSLAVRLLDDKLKAEFISFAYIFDVAY